MLPVLMTAMVNERLSARWTDDHWELRRQAAQAIRHASPRLFGKYPSLRQKYISMLSEKLGEASLTQCYGILLAWRALGPRTVEKVLHPIMVQVLQEKILPHLTNPRTLRQRHDVIMVTNLILEIAGSYLRPKTLRPKKLDGKPGKGPPNWAWAISEIFSENL